MPRYTLVIEIVIPVVVGFFGLFFVGSIALAQTSTTSSTQEGLTSIVFPIAALGGCTSRDDCRVYCNASAHQDACFAFALSHKLMSQAQISLAKEINRSVGPGGCMGESCRTYCNDPMNHTVCVAFAEVHHIVLRPLASTTSRMDSDTGPRIASSTTQGDNPRAKLIGELLRKIMGPGGCSSADACKMYCADASHNTECLQFARTHSLMSTTSIDRAEGFIKMRDGIRASSTPTRPPLPKRDGNGSSTPPKVRPQLERGTPTAPHPELRATTTNKNSDDYRQPPIPPPGANVDTSKPPYHCTPAQAEEGACDPDNLPGSPQDTSLSGTVYNAFKGVLNYFGW